MRRIGLSLVLAVALTLGLVAPAMAENPTVTITISAQITSITNTQDTWTAGAVVAGASAIKWGTSDTYSTVENTGNVAVDVEIQGTNFEGGAFDWTLSNVGTAGDQIYALMANSDHSTTYNITVKSSSYLDLITNLAATGSDTWTWSMQLTPPTAFNPSDAGASKTATVTLVASLHT
jgi:hypothetical protein